MQNLEVADYSDLIVPQLKALRVKIDKAIEKSNSNAEQLEKERNKLLGQIGNLVHHSVPVSNDEANNKVERIQGDVSIRKQYSHVRKQMFFFLKFIIFRWIWL